MLNITEDMRNTLRSILIIISSVILILSIGIMAAQAQDEEDDALVNDNLEEEILNDPEDQDEGTQDQQIGEEEEEEPEEGIEEEEPGKKPAADEELKDVPKVEGGEPGEGENRRKVKISGLVVMNYVFENSSDTFTVKYLWELEGDANAETAVIKGDATIDATVEGFLAKWPTGECSLNISIPKVPFELSFNKQDEEKGNLRLVFKKAITENWQSNCTFADAPGAKFETSGPPEKWFEKALTKARPPLRSIVVNLNEAETMTQLVIAKEIIGDPPIGSIEIEGNAVITISGNPENQ